MTDETYGRTPGPLVLPEAPAVEVGEPMEAPAPAAPYQEERLHGRSAGPLVLPIDEEPPPAIEPIEPVVARADSVAMPTIQDTATARTILRDLTPSTYVPLSPLEYTINRLIEQHLIQIERDTASKDIYGAEAKRSWGLHATIEGLFWWWPTHGAGRFVEEATPQRAVDITGGGCLFPIGTDVTEMDRLGNIKDPDGNLEVEGPFRIVSLRRLPTHLEISVERP